MRKNWIEKKNFNSVVCSGNWYCVPPKEFKLGLTPPDPIAIIIRPMNVNALE